MIYVYHTFSRGSAVPPDKYRRSEDEFVRDMRKLTTEDEIHIDDGMCSAYEVAVPRMRAQLRTAAFMISAAKVSVSGFVSAEQIRELVQQRHEIGCHGLEHVDLRFLPEEEVERQLSSAKEILEGIIKKPVVKFVAPYEGYNEMVIRVVRKLGMIPQLERVTVYNSTEFKDPPVDVSSPEYWDTVFSPKPPEPGGPAPAKKEPGGHENDRYVEVERFIGEEGAILDCGAGWGDLAKRLRRKYPERKIECLDQSAQAARQSGFLPYHVSSVYQMPFAHKEFEYLVTCQMMEYVQDEHQALNEICRVSNYAIITVPRGKHETCSQLRIYDLESWKRMLGSYGEVQECYEKGPILVAKMKF